MKMDRGTADINRAIVRQLAARFGVEIDRKEANILRSAGNVLQSWAELQCGVGVDGGTVAIEQDEDTGAWTHNWRGHINGEYQIVSTLQEDLATGAKKRIADTLAPHGLVFRHRLDPLGLPIFIRRAGEARDWNYGSAGLELVTT